MEILNTVNNLRVRLMKPTRPVQGQRLFAALKAAEKEAYWASYELNAAAGYARDHSQAIAWRSADDWLPMASVPADDWWGQPLETYRGHRWVVNGGSCAAAQLACAVLTGGITVPAATFVATAKTGQVWACSVRFDQQAARIRAVLSGR